MNDIDDPDILAKLEAIEASLKPGPWNSAAVGGAMKYLVRQTEILEDYLDNRPGSEPQGLPRDTDGYDLAELRNLLPAIIAVLKKKK